MTTGRRRLRSGRLPASCAKSGTLFRFLAATERENGLRNKKDVKFMARTGNELKRLAARTAGVMEDMVIL
jgi:hypothetical protein